MEIGPAVRETISKWGYDSATVIERDGVEDAVAEGVLHDLHLRGISLGSAGIPLPESLEHVQEARALRPPTPQRNLLSHMLRFVATRKFDALFAAASERSQTRLLSASGPTAGKSLIAAAGLKQAHFSDEDFTTIVKQRLGIQTRSADGRCLNVKADGDVCEEVLDDHADHALCCPCGPLRIQPHNAYADELANCITETGVHVRREAWIKEFTSESSDAYLDVWAFGTPDVIDVLIDVTIRHPMAAAYQPSAARVQGHAAASGEREKKERYPAAGGRSMTPFAVETWGRLGDEAEELLQTLAAAATRRETRRGHVPIPGTILKRWRASLDATLQRGIARSVQSALFGLPGKPHKRCQ